MGIRFKSSVFPHIDGGFPQIYKSIGEDPKNLSFFLVAKQQGIFEIMPYNECVTFIEENGGSIWNAKLIQGRVGFYGAYAPSIRGDGVNCQSLSDISVFHSIAQLMHKKEIDMSSLSIYDRNYRSNPISIVDFLIYKYFIERRKF